MARAAESGASEPNRLMGEVVALGWSVGGSVLPHLEIFENPAEHKGIMRVQIEAGG